MIIETDKQLWSNNADYHYDYEIIISIMLIITFFFGEQEMNNNYYILWLTMAK